MCLSHKRLKYNLINNIINGQYRNITGKILKGDFYYV